MRRALSLIPVLGIAACAGGLPNPPAPPTSLDPASLSDPAVCGEIVKAQGWVDYIRAYGTLAGYDVDEQLEKLEIYGNVVEAQNQICKTTDGEVVEAEAVSEDLVEAVSEVAAE